MSGVPQSGLKYKLTSSWRWLRDSLNPRTLKSKFWSINFLIACLFWTGASASAMQGYFSINVFITSLGSAVSWLAFLNAIPYVVIFACATIIAVYSIRVESQVFRPYFEKLIKQFMGDPAVKKNHDYKTIVLKNRLNKIIKAATVENTKVEKTGLIKLLYKTKYYLQFVLAVEKSTDNKYSFAWFINRLRYYFAHALAVGVMGLRAIVSIGSTMLGLKSIFLLIASVFLITSLPTYLIPLYALMSGVGYFIKTSQNLVDQFHETLKVIGYNRYIKKDYDKLKKTYKKELKKVLDLSKNKYKDKNENENVAITADVLPALPPPPVKDLPQWKKVYYWLKDNIKNILWYALTLGFCIGAVGASMTGFFSITSFITQLGSVPLLSFLLLIPSPVIIALAITIAVYTLVVEQKILYRYFNGLVLNMLGIKAEQDTTKTKDSKTAKTIDEEINDKKLKIQTLYSKLRIKKPDQYNIDLSLITSEEPQASSAPAKATKIDAKQHGFIKYNLAIIATVFILFLRAITSIGPSTLGLKNAANMVIAPLFCLAAFGPASFAICAIMATFGYAIKCSQNIHTHFYNTMEDMLGVKSEGKEKKKQLRKLEREYLTALELVAVEKKLITLDGPPVRFSLGGKASSGSIDLGRATPPPGLPSPAIGGP